MRVTTQTVAPGGQILFGLGNYFRLLVCPNGVDVVLNGDNGTPVDEFFNVVGGIGFAALDDLGRRRQYNSGSITSATAQTIIYGYGFGDVSFDISQGTVNVTQPGTVTSSPDIVLAAGAGTLVLAATAGNRETLVSNLTANASIIRVGGLATLTALKGIEIAPGQTGSIAGNAAIYAWNPGAIQSVGVISIAN